MRLPPFRLRRANGGSIGSGVLVGECGHACCRLPSGTPEVPVTVSVSVPSAARKAEAGRQIAEALREWERFSGRRVMS